MAQSSIIYVFNGPVSGWMLSKLGMQSTRLRYATAIPLPFALEAKRSNG